MTKKEAHKLASKIHQACGTGGQKTYESISVHIKDNYDPQSWYVRAVNRINGGVDKFTEVNSDYTNKKK